MVLGVTEKEIGYTFAQSLREGGVERALVVCGYEKMDEISCAGPTWTWELKDGQITEGTLTPEDFGLGRHGLNKVVGGGPEENAETFKRLLNSGGRVPEELTPVLDFVLMNASALLVVAGIAKNYKEGTDLARESVLSGKAWRALEIFRDEGQKLGGCSIFLLFPPTAHGNCPSPKPKTK
jgi:anthranilate phosphoribosyltransferase